MHRAFGFAADDETLLACLFFERPGMILLAAVRQFVEASYKLDLRHCKMRWQPCQQCLFRSPKCKNAFDRPKKNKNKKNRYSLDRTFGSTERATSTCAVLPLRSVSM
jgi:hypothetical protein